MKFTRWCVAATGAVVLVAGCPKRAGPPSPEFEKARDRFFALEASDPTAVFTNPEVKGLLPAIEGVAADSVEKPAAEDLAKTIHEGLADAEKTATERAKSIEAANKPVVFVAAAAGSDTPTPAPMAAPASAVDAGPATDPGPTVGTSTAELTGRYGSCFSKTGAYTDDKGGTGETYAPNADPSCVRKYPAWANSILLVQGGKVANMVPSSSVTAKTSFTLGTNAEKAGVAPTPAPSPAPTSAAPVLPSPPVSAAPVLPAPANDQITTPPTDPNVNPDAINK